MGVGVAVAHGFAGNDGAEAVLEGVDGRCADAAGGGCAGDDEGIYAGGGEETGEAGAEEARGEKFVEDWLRLFWGYAGVDLGPAGSGLRVRSAGTLSMKAAAVSLSLLAVGDGGEDDGDLRPSGCSQESSVSPRWGLRGRRPGEIPDL